MPKQDPKAPRSMVPKGGRASASREQQQQDREAAERDQAGAGPLHQGRDWAQKGTDRRTAK
jgi:hypothetical protein